MNRITNSNLESLVLRINKTLKRPETPYTREGERNKANIGNFHLSFAYGGICLHEMHNEGGSVNTVLNTGYTTKRELWDAMQAFLKGIEAGRE